MHPPAWLCEGLYRVRPDLRLAWHGSKRKHKDDLNAGTFAIVRLAPVSEVGSLSNPRTYGALWDLAPQINDVGECEMLPHYKGPIFNRKGGTSRDWDPLFFVPMYSLNLEGQGITKSQIFAGAFLNGIEWGLNVMKARVAKANQAAYNDHKNEMQAIGNEAGKDLWKKANQSDASTVLTTREERVEAMKGFEKKKAKREARLKAYHNVE